MDCQGIVAYTRYGAPAGNHIGSLPEHYRGLSATTMQRNKPCVAPPLNLPMAGRDALLPSPDSIALVSPRIHDLGILIIADLLRWSGENRASGRDPDTELNPSHFSSSAWPKSMTPNSLDPCLPETMAHYLSMSRLWEELVINIMASTISDGHTDSLGPVILATVANMGEISPRKEDFDIDYILENASSLEKISLLAGETKRRARI